MKKVKNQTPKLKKNQNFCKYLCKIIVGDGQQPEKALTLNSTNPLNPLNPVNGSLPNFLLPNYQLR
jgi:hypothetical protein